MISLKWYSRAAFSFLVLAVALLPSCKKAAKPEAILNEAVFSEPASLDPRAQVDAETYNIMYTIYNTLVELDDSMKVVPALAQRWETTDFKNWRFFIRKNAYFHTDSCFKNEPKTRLLSASDIEYSLNRALQPGGVGAFVLTDIVEGAAAVNEGKAAQARGIKAINDSTLEIVLIKPYTKLLERLATPFLFIVAKEAVDFYGDRFGQHPVGTGPFQLQRLEPGQAVYLQKNARYWKRDKQGNPLPKLGGVKFRIFHDPQIAFTEFKNGNLDAIDVPAVLASSISKDGKPLPEYQKYKFLTAVAIDVHYFAFRMDKPPFKGNVALRQAMNYAVDKHKITSVLLNGLAKPAVGVLPPGVYPDFHRNEVYPYDPAKARSKLEEAGYTDGKVLPELTLTIDNKATTEVVAQFVQSNLQDIGIKVNLRKMEFNTLLGEVGQGNLDFYYMYWAGTDPNAEIFMVQFKSDLLPEKGGYNFGRYSQPEADALFDQAVAQLDERKAIDIWLKLNASLIEQAPWIFLYHTEIVRMLQPNISDYDNNSLQIRRFAATVKTL